ncbi:Glycosyl-transferase family 4 [Pseudobutyrivibrio sp. 49]|uniref:glycosyltransferase family 4 protein n=1 Tax=Pseudobutyrivibrio sp. 49 TaxID=1855344 RepID=UPI00087FC926|nr:glycosyltransferase family 4 protein [Pseudobutyrivibrio sp. 49]SDI34652.1 Glycosyl-transferase family 4 [Pseudobutyrivibrio sp. 49]
MISKKILLVSFEMTYSGSPVATLKMARVLRKMGYQVDIWTLNEGPFAIEFSRDGFEVKNINFPADAGQELEDLLSEYKLCICHTIFCSEIACYIQRIVNTVLYIHEAGNISDLIDDCDINLDDFLNIKRYWCVSEYAKEKILEKYSLNKLDILPNYVDRYLVDRKPRSDTKLRLCIAGTVEYRKGLDVVVKALDLLPEEKQECVELHVIGRIPVWAESYASDNLNHKCIQYHGEIQDVSTLFDLYASMDLFIVASRDESCSLVALEAAMLKKPLLVTENTGAKYVLDNPKMILKTEDERELANGIMNFMENRSLISYEGNKNYKRYKRKASLRNYKKQLKHNIYKIKFSL